MPWLPRNSYLLCGAHGGLEGMCKAHQKILKKPLAIVFASDILTAPFP
jgi:hypothetical protein